MPVTAIPIDTAKPEPAPEEPREFSPEPMIEALERPRNAIWPAPMRRAVAPSQSDLPGASHAKTSSQSGGGVESAPALVFWEIPRQVRKRFKGRVVARIQINELGRAIFVELAQGTQNSALDADLVIALYAARYMPATQGGRSVPACLRQPIDFE